MAYTEYVTYPLNASKTETDSRIDKLYVDKIKKHLETLRGNKTLETQKPDCRCAVAEFLHANPQVTVGELRILYTEDLVGEVLHKFPFHVKIHYTDENHRYKIYDPWNNGDVLRSYPLTIKKQMDTGRVKEYFVPLKRIRG